MKIDVLYTGQMYESVNSDADRQTHTLRFESEFGDIKRIRETQLDERTTVVWLKQCNQFCTTLKHLKNKQFEQGT